MVGGLSFCPPITRPHHYHPSSYLIIIGVCKTHPTKVNTGIPQAHAGCSLQWRLHLCGLFSFPRFSTSKSQWSAFVLIRNAAEQRTARIRLKYNVAHLVTFQLAEILSSGEGWPGGLFSLSSSTAFSKKLAVCLNLTSISDIELFFLSVIQKLPEKATLGVIRNSKVDRKRRFWCHP